LNLSRISAVAFRSFSRAIRIPADIPIELIYLTDRGSVVVSAR
jgi:hypothetical protein